MQLEDPAQSGSKGWPATEDLQAIKRLNVEALKHWIFGEPK